MSERSGSPVSAFTSRRMSSPSSIPGPRKESIDVRLALSNDDLKTRLIFNSSRSARSVRAIRNACSRDSMTHGPAMKRGGWSPPNEMVSVMAMGRVLMCGALYSPRYTRHVGNELFETLTQFYREILKPAFDRL